MSSSDFLPSSPEYQDLHDKYLHYSCLVERLVVHFRQISMKDIKPAHAAAVKTYTDESSPYPQIMPKRGATADFWKLVAELGPQWTESEAVPASLSLYECALQHFVSLAAMMCITSVELNHLSAAQRGRILMAWQDELCGAHVSRPAQNLTLGDHSVAKVLQYEREAGLRPPQDLDFEIPSHVHGGPSIHQWQGRKLKAAIPREPVKEYIVVDIISSHVDGVTVKLQDLTSGQERVVPEEDFEEMIRSLEIHLLVRCLTFSSVCREIGRHDLLDLFGYLEQYEATRWNGV